MRMINGLMQANPIMFWVIAFVVVTLSFTVLKGFFLARKIQPKGFKFKTLRNELLFALVGGVLTGVILGGFTRFLGSHGLGAHSEGPTAWWVIAIEYVGFFVGFDTWFYWFHRLMHTKPVYPWIHQLHHFSISPNPLTTFSVNPLESLVNGGWMPLYAAGAVLVGHPLHVVTVGMMGATTIFMGLYVHMGFEFLPRWWHKTWFTKWFITTTFHDQHHRWFNCNYGGFTPVWDYLMGTVRPQYEADFDAIKARTAKKKPDAAAPEAVAAE